MQSKKFLVNIDLVLSIQMTEEDSKNDDKMKEIVKATLIQKAHFEDPVSWLMENIGEIRPDEQQVKVLKKVTELSENEGVHCPTLFDAIAFCELMDEAGLTWLDGESYINMNHWHNDKMVYYPKKGIWGRLNDELARKSTIYSMSDIEQAHIDTEKEAYEEGRIAWAAFEKSNKMVKGNPYDKGTLEFTTWNKGFNVG